MDNPPIKHGGNLREVAQRYNIPFHDWIDLSTGINPNSWQPPEIPPYVWQRLPEDNDGLLEAAQKYYGVAHILPVSGSQAAIQCLPHCRPCSRIGIISPAYAEYGYCWQQAGHKVIEFHRDEVEKHLPDLDVLIIINPNNPDAYLHSTAVLMRWHQQLKKRGGWLIVDEAFMDSTPENSLLHQRSSSLANLIILRSFGKFFGLAGIRLGFVIATPALLQQIKRQQSSWAIPHPTRWLGRQALQDTEWQENTKNHLRLNAKQLKQCLASVGIKNIYSTNLFCYFELDTAKALQNHLAQQGIWVRYFKQPSAIRIGLSQNKAALLRLQKELKVYFTQTKAYREVENN